jgi:uncharacterized protein YcgL (UPF0745 family)
MRSFGTPQMAMLLPLDGRKKLVNADLEKVKQALANRAITCNFLRLKIY